MKRIPCLTPIGGQEDWVACSIKITLIEEVTWNQGLGEHQQEKVSSVAKFLEACIFVTTILTAARSCNQLYSKEVPLLTFNQLHTTQANWTEALLQSHFLIVKFVFVLFLGLTD